MTKRTGFIWHETFMWHQLGKRSGLMPADFPMQPGVPYESPEGKRRIKNLFDAIGFTEKLVALTPRTATDEELLRVHAPGYLKQLAADNLLPEAMAGFDAPFSRGSFDIARLAAGGAIEAIDAIFAGVIDNAYLLARPIGHHAEADEGKGFCLINNGAVAAAHALEEHGVDRVAFVDLDVHHGNGAERIFWSDPRVLTISLHQENWFPPNSGDSGSLGGGAAVGTNINVPLPAGCGFGAYRHALEHVVLPALDAFEPDLLIVPFGFDAGAQDPLGRMILGSNHFRFFADALSKAADRHCSGRMLLTHEGGYNESTVPFMALAVVEAISGLQSGADDPYGLIMDSMHGHELLDHQREAVARAAMRGLAALLERPAISAKLSAA